MSSPYQDPSQPPYSQPPYGQPQYAPPPPPAYPQQPAAPYGQPMPYAAPGMPMAVAQPNGLALASLITGICGILPCVGIISAIVAIVTGHMALSRANQLPPQLARRGMALAGLILGYAWVALGILGIILFIVASPSSSIQ